MKKAPTNGWKTCTRGHKYRGSVCPICWQAEKEQKREKARAKSARDRARAG